MSDRMKELRRFGSTIASFQDAASDDAAVLAAVRRRLLMTKSTDQRASRLSLGAYALAGSLAAICLISLLHLARTRPLELTDLTVLGSTSHGPFQAGSREGTLRFADGTQLVVSPGARLTADELGQTGYRVRLEAGLTRATVVHQEKTRWSFDAGPFSVLVTGTQFELSWDPAQSQVRVEVQKGSVVVSGCGLQNVPLSVGEAFEATCEAGEARTVAGLPPNSKPQTTPSLSSLSPNADAGVGAAQSPVFPAVSSTLDTTDEDKSPQKTQADHPDTDAGPSWLDLAHQGKREQAYLVASSLGFEGECERTTAEGLLMLADVASFSRRWDHATHALLSLRRRYPGTPQASIAAFRLGRLAFDQRRDMQGAAGWFNLYLREGSAGGLEREALGRLIECEQQQGHRQQARDLAAIYLSRFPNGPHAAVASSALAAQ